MPDTNEPRVADIILQQLGGHKFAVMTGASHFISDGNTLRMTLPRNKSKANRLFITLDDDDTYTMRFFHYTSPRLDSKTLAYKPEKVTEVALYNGVYFDQLCSIFESVTWLYTHL